MAGRDEAVFEAYVASDGGRLLGFALLLAGNYQDAEDPGHPGWYIGSCLLASADRTGGHLLVSCDRFGRLDRGRFTALPGAAPQSAVAAAW